MNISAVILSSKPVKRVIPGVEVVPYYSVFNDAAGLLESRLNALAQVKTEWFFYLDDDDELPEDYAEVLQQCIAAKTPLAYTDELITGDNARLRKSAPYSQDVFIRNPLLVHHLAVCNVNAARRAMYFIPHGTFTVENLLFFQVAKGGATYIPRVGYIWHRKPTGLSNTPNLIIAQVQSSTWAARHKL